GFESHLVTLKKYNSQQALKKASPKTSATLRSRAEADFSLSRSHGFQRAMPFGGFQGRALSLSQTTRASCAVSFVAD
ncbi:hypothetical protein, partial [Gluconacetobacter entanii]